MNRLKKKEKWTEILRLLKKGIGRLVLHNGWVKLLAVLISVILWAGLISQDPNITRNRTFQGVKVSVLGSPNGFAVTSDISGVLADVTVSVPQLQYENAEASDYNLRIDLSSIHSAGEQELKILSTDHPELGRVISISPSTVKVTVEELISYTTEGIIVEQIGTIPEGWSLEEPSVGMRTITVSGPASVIREIGNITVGLDLSAVRWEDGYRTAQIGRIKIYNQKAEDITDLVEKDLDSTQVLVRAREEYTSISQVPVNIRTAGEVPDGWYISVSTVLDEGISVTGPASVVKEVHSAAVTLDLNTLKWEEGTITALGEVKLFNSQQEEISDTKLTITGEGGDIDRLPIEATILPTQDFALADMIQTAGKPAEGYEQTGVQISAETVTIAGTTEKLQEIESLPAEQRAVKILKNNIVDIADATETRTEEFSMKALTFSKDKAVVVRPDKVYVTVEISPVQAEETPGTEGSPPETQGKEP